MSSVGSCVRSCVLQDRGRNELRALEPHVAEPVSYSTTVDLRELGVDFAVGHPTMTLARRCPISLYLDLNSLVQAPP